ncbi:MAG: serine/threonine-protein kinase [Planctomycetota bacterium]|nr:MAG: serine/threonine-protein kinase [Planctomycetota bacterium]
MTCLSETDFQALFDGTLEESERARVLSHLDACRSCRVAYEQYAACRRAADSSGSSAASSNDTAAAEGPREKGSSGAGSSGNERAFPSLSAPQVRASKRFPKIEGYRITGVLGQGGMGIVYQAVQTKLDRAVALKVLPAMIGAANPAAVSRFRREATAAARLHHSHIIPIYDFGECRDAYYYAMELIPGQPLNKLVQHLSRHDPSNATANDLAELLAGMEAEVSPEEAGADPSSVSLDRGSSGATMSGRGRIYFRQVARWMADVADALHYAHGQGIIHRDVKPANLILSVDGRMMVADFGLAKIAEDQSVTITGSLLGTLRYISPEQAMAKRVRVDHRTDIYSLGVTMYELLCFRPAYPGDDDKEILGRIIAHDPPSPRKINPAVPHELDTICMKCMEKAPEARYPTARAMGEDLERFLNDLPIVARPPGAWTRTVKFVRRRKMAVTAVTASVLIAAAALYSFHQRRARRVAEVRRAYESGMWYLNDKHLDWERAEAEFLRGLSYDPDDLDNLLGLTWKHLRYHNLVSGVDEEEARRALQEAERFARRALAVAPDDPRPLGYLGVALRRQKRFDEAIEVLTRALKLHPDDATAYHSWSNLGAVYAESGDLKTAEHYLREGAKRAGTEIQAPERAMAWRNLAVLELFLKEPKSWEHIETARRCWGSDPLTWTVRARIQMEIPEYRAPSEALADALSADRMAGFRNPYAKRVLATAYLANGRWEEAANQAREALNLKDLPTPNHLIQAVADARRGNPESARKHLVRAEDDWPAQLRMPGAFVATAEAGNLWIESADQLLDLRKEAESALKTKETSPSP